MKNILIVLGLLVITLFIPATSAVCSEAWQCGGNRVASGTSVVCADGKVCDLSSHKCVTQGDGRYCGDNVCHATSESNNPALPNYCKADCSGIVTETVTKEVMPSWGYLVIGILSMGMIIIGTKAFSKKSK